MISATLRKILGPRKARKDTKRDSGFVSFRGLLLLAAFAGTHVAGAADKAPLTIAEVQRAEPVNFDREVVPFLSDNCLACHCQTTRKGGLNLETP